MQPPKIDNSTKEERRAYVLEAWKCLHDCEACGKSYFHSYIIYANRSSKITSLCIIPECEF